MYLIRLEIPLQSRQAAGFLTDSQKLHRMLTGLFARSRQNVSLLYRLQLLQGVIRIYLYADSLPEHDPPLGVITGQRDLTAWLEELQEGQIRGFDLNVMPSRKVYQSQRDRNSQRRVLRLPEERLAWLHRKAEQHGFAILQVEERESSHPTARHPSDKGGLMHLDAYRYTGTLRITDAERFREAVRTGIGPGKAYGMGMLLLTSL